MMFEWIAALSLGLVGSFHCVGMCGPIALALPLQKGSWLYRIWGGMAYNLGRTVTYGLMGVVFGLLGAGLVIAGLQRWLSVAMGAVMILTVLIPYIFGGSFSAENLGGGLFRKLSKGFGMLLSKGTPSALFLIGLMNGLLPCGLVYVALAGALAAGHPLGSALFMVLFGLGTLPMLLMVSLAGNLVSRSIRSFINRLIPWVVVLIGILFILRGLNLGIPYISPKEEKLHIRKTSADRSKQGCCAMVDVERIDDFRASPGQNSDSVTVS